MVPLRIFGTHIFLTICMVVALSSSFLLNHDSLMQRFWGVTISLSMGMVLLSNYVVQIKKLSKNFATKLRESREPAVSFSHSTSIS